MQRIDLTDYTMPNSRVFSGVGRGQQAAADANLCLVSADDRIEVHVPEDTVAMCFSFFRGMFGSVIERLGRDVFVQIFKFTGRDIARVVEAGLSDGDRYRRFQK
jgi:hypothetical protein